MTKNTRLQISHINIDFPITELQNPAWKLAKEVSIQKYWSGEAAPEGRHAKARLLWSDFGLYIRFEANRDEPLVVSDPPNLTSKTLGLWDRDVCEIFIAPDKDKRNKYFEFEIAPNGEWVDLGIEVLPAKRVTDWDYNSGMESAVIIEDKKIVMAVRIAWKAFGNTPKAGDVWLGNLFRCVGRDPTRGYLAWQPTMTETPNFHVPEKFGEFEFVK
jgi:alpha-galactosidase